MTPRHANPDSATLVKNRLARVAVLALSAVSCGGRTASPATRPVDSDLAIQAARNTAITRPIQVIFDWRLQDREGRFSGQGVLRVEPDRARLDLFGPRGEGYLSAVLDGLELRLPPGSGEAPLPPPPLFWTVLGVFRAPPGATLAAAEVQDGESRLEYVSGQDTWRFGLEGSMLLRAEWTGGGQGRRTVELTGRHALGPPLRARYRDWPAFLELELTANEIFEVDAFPNDIWTLRRP